MLLRLLSIPTALLCLFAATSCSDKAPPAKAPVKEPAAPVSTAKTAGVLRFEGLPSGSVAEVLIVSSLSEEARQRMQRQRELFEIKMAGVSEAAAEVDALPIISSEDAAALEQQMTQLRSKYPPRASLEFETENSLPRKFQSDPKLVQEYQHLFSSLDFENLERGLKFIAEKIEADDKAIIERGGRENSNKFKQAQVNMRWLNRLKGHFDEYVSLTKDYFKAQNRYQQALAAAETSEPKTWDEYSAVYANTLIIDLAGDLQGSAYVSADGSFESEGQGIMVVRVEMGGLSAYFFPEDPAEKRVRIVTLRKQERNETLDKF